jgi:hypothetical protein
MARVAARISDKRVLKLIRAFLKAGVMEDGLDEGTPQGGPLSPLLSNIRLDDLDKELARRGHRFCRYADDCNIYVRSIRAGERVMASVSRFLTVRLRLKVNETKSAVARPEERKFLGFSISGGVDSSKVTLIPLAAVGERAQPLQGIAPSWRIAVPSGGRRRFTDGILAYVRTPGGPSGPAQPLLRFTRSSPTLCSGRGLTRSNRRGTRPVCPVVWEGRRREASPLFRSYVFMPIAAHKHVSRPCP